MADGLDVVDSAAQDKATADRTGLPILKITRITTKTDRFPYPASGLVWRRLIHHRTSISSINERQTQQPRPQQPQTEASTKQHLKRSGCRNDLRLNKATVLPFWQNVSGAIALYQPPQL